MRGTRARRDELVAVDGVSVVHLLDLAQVVETTLCNPITPTAVAASSKPLCGLCRPLAKDRGWMP